MKPVLFLILHGVEYKELEDDYAAKFIEAIRGYLPKDSPIILRAYNWSRLVEGREALTFENVKKSHPFVRWWILRLICYVLCDTWWYLRTRAKTGTGDIFKKVHDGISYEVEVFKKANPEGLVVLCGHSWGSQVVLDACFQGFQVDGLVTMGSCIYYLSGAYDDWGVPPVLKGWVNFFNPLDPIATRIDENPNFKGSVEVVKIISLNPLNWPSVQAHCHYWESADVHKKIAKKLLEIGSL